MEMREILKEVEEKRRKLQLGGGPEAIAKQHSRGKLTARERLELLFDRGTFTEIGLWYKPMLTGFPIDSRDVPADAVITGYGEVDGRPVYAYAHDFTVLAGTSAQVHVEKVSGILQLAIKERVPFIGLNDSYSGRAETILRGAWRVGYHPLFYLHTVASGVIPQISLMMGPCSAGIAYAPILTDFLLFVEKNSYMYVISPATVKTSTFQDVTDEELGGAEMHAKVSGQCDVLVKNDEDCIQKAKQLLSYLPSSNLEMPPIMDTGDDPNRRDEELLDIVPTNPKKVYDMHNVIKHIVDNGEFFEIKAEYAKNIIVGFARIGGYSVGIIANNPMHLAGCMTVDSSVKEARFIRFCDAFNIPLVFLADTTAYIGAVDQERRGLVKHGSQVLFAVSEATVPKITVVIRKYYGGGTAAMGIKPLGNDLVVGWPTAEAGGIGSEEAVDLIYRKELMSAADPQKLRQQKLEEYMKARGKDPFHGAEVQWIEEIIDPRDTRPLIVKTLKATRNKRVELPWKKHGNIQL